MGDVSQAFLVHGDLAHLQRAGMWPAFSDLVARAGRTRGFGDWWGGVLLTRRSAPLVPGFQEVVLSCNRHLADELSRALGF